MRKTSVIKNLIPFVLIIYFIAKKIIKQILWIKNFSKNLKGQNYISHSIYYYEYNSISNENNLNITLQNFRDKYKIGENQYDLIDILNKGIACEFLRNENSEDFIACLYYTIRGTENFFVIHQFNINNSLIDTDGFYHVLNSGNNRMF